VLRVNEAQELDDFWIAEPGKQRSCVGTRARRDHLAEVDDVSMTRDVGEPVDQYVWNLVSWTLDKEPDEIIPSGMDVRVLPKKYEQTQVLFVLLV